MQGPSIWLTVVDIGFKRDVLNEEFEITKSD